MGGASKMKIMGPLHCFYLIIVMLSVDINVAQDSQGQCSVAKRYRVRDELDAQQYLTGSSLRMMLTGGKVPSVALQPTPNVQ